MLFRSLLLRIIRMQLYPLHSDYSQQKAAFSLAWRVREVGNDEGYASARTLLIIKLLALSSFSGLVFDESDSLFFFPRK